MWKQKESGTACNFKNCKWESNLHGKYYTRRKWLDIHINAEWYHKTKLHMQQIL
jgi:hypothetical protein